MAISPVSALNAPTNLTGEAQNRFARPATARRKFRMCAVFPCNGKAASDRRKSDRRKFEPNTAISGKQSYLRAYILYLSTRDRCGLFRCCALRPLLAWSIIAKTDLLPAGFAGLRHLGRWLCHRPFFCFEYGSSPFQDAEVALWSIMGGARRLRSIQDPASIPSEFLNLNLMALPPAPT